MRVLNHYVLKLFHLLLTLFFPLTLIYHLSSSLNSQLLSPNHSPVVHIQAKSFAKMVGTRQGTNTFGKENKSSKKLKKSSKEDIAGVNVQRVKMKGVAIEGLANGQVGGPSLIKQPNEIRNKKIKKTRDRAPLTMYDLIEKGIENVIKFSKDTKDSIDTQ